MRSQSSARPLLPAGLQSAWLTFCARFQGIKDWINAALGRGRRGFGPETTDGGKGEPISQDTDRKTTVGAAQSLLMTLRKESREADASVRELSAKLVALVPPTLETARRVGAEARGLRSQVSALAKSLDAVGGPTGAGPLAEIAPLHKAKSRISTFTNTLQELNNWSSRLQTIESVFESRDLDAIGVQVASLHQSAQASKGLSDHESREKQLAALQDRLELMANPRLLAAMDSRDAAAIHAIVGVLAKIGRKGGVRRYFLRSRLERLDSLLQRHAADDQGGASPLVWLPKFTRSAIDLMRSDTKWAAEAFAGLDDGVVDAYVNAASRALEAKAVAKIRTVLKGFGYDKGGGSQSDGETAAESVRSAFEVCCELASGVCGLRSNKNNSENKDGSKDDPGTPQLTTRDVISLIAGPVLDADAWVPAAERGAARDAFASILSEYKGDDSAVAAVRSAMKRVEEWTKACVARCVAVSGGTRGPEIMSAIDESMAELFKGLSQRLSIGTPAVSAPATASEEPETDWSYLARGFQLLGEARKLRPRVARVAELTEGRLGEALRATLKGGFPSPRLSETAPRGAETGSERKARTAFDVLLHHAMLERDSARAAKLNETGIPRGLPRAVAALGELEQSIEGLVVSGMMSPVRAQLKGLEEWGVWVEEPEETAVALPTFSMQPSDYITRIGEHMLTLVHQLEDASGCGGEAGDDTDGKSDGKTDGGDGSRQGGAQSAPNNPMRWIAIVASKTLQVLQQRVRSIGRFSPKGKAQMEADVKYLNNVVSVLDVDVDGADKELRTALDSAKVAVESSPARSEETKTGESES